MSATREESAGAGEEAARRVLYCLIPFELAAKLHDPLRAHFARADPAVEVVVEQRGRERRREAERRTACGEGPGGEERRLIRNAAGRRVGERRAAQVAAPTPALPRRASRHSDRLTFVERLEPTSRELENLDTARLVLRFQAGETEETFTLLYARYFERANGYLRLLIKDQHEAEDATQDVFASAYEALPNYEHRGRPFRAWLFTVVRNQALMRLRKSGRLELLEPEELTRAQERLEPSRDPAPVLDWISDRDLMLFVERLPLPQRQVLLLRYMLDLPGREIAAILGRSEADVRILNHRALRFLEQRLGAIGRGPERGKPVRMRECTKQATVLRARRYALY